MRLPQLPPPATWSSSAWALVAANLVPAVGVFAFHWEVAPLLWFYWIENIVAGAEDRCGTLLFGKLFVGGFFAVHYGGFCFGHAIFLQMLTPGEEAAAPGVWLGSLGPLRAVPGGWWALAAYAASHGWSFASQYIAKGECVTAKLSEEMFRPYKRIVVMHLTVLLGAGAFYALSAPHGALLVLIALKTVVDLTAHLHDHQQRAARAAAVSGAIES
jgi:hypothetical protein